MGLAILFTLRLIIISLFLTISYSLLFMLFPPTPPLTYQATGIIGYRYLCLFLLFLRRRRIHPSRRRLPSSFVTRRVLYRRCLRLCLLFTPAWAPAQTWPRPLLWTPPSPGKGSKIGDFSDIFYLRSFLSLFYSYLLLLLSIFKVLYIPLPYLLK